MKWRLFSFTESACAASILLFVFLLLSLHPTLTIADSLPAGGSIEALLPEAQSIVRYRINGREMPLFPGDWVPSDADIFISVEGANQGGVRAVRAEIVALEEGERVLVEVPGLQEWDKQTRKWIHIDLEPDEAASGRWIWSGTFRPGDRIVIQWRDADSGLIVPHPVTLRIVDSFGAKLAFATPVSIVFPVTADATVTASAGFSMRYYRISNRSFWRTLERIGFPAIAFSYATIGGQKSVLYSIGISAIDDQLYLSYGGFRNTLTANNFWMVGLSLKTSDLVAAAKRALK
ncbi:hypothetical protein ACFL3H_02325 [Gemmatimonadota bacterium]